MRGLILGFSPGLTMTDGILVRLFGVPDDSWSIIPGLKIMDIPVDPRRNMVGLAVISIGAVMCAFGVLRRLETHSRNKEQHL